MASRPPASIAAFAVGSFVLLAALAAFGFMYSGWYSVAATEQHLRPTFRALDIALRRSVERRARAIAVPAFDVPAARSRGLTCFKAHCAQCHGAPGVGREEFAKGMLPVPSSLSQAAHTTSRRSGSIFSWHALSAETFELQTPFQGNVRTTHMHMNVFALEGSRPAALGNALAAAIGTRLRELPLARANIKRALGL